MTGFEGREIVLLDPNHPYAVRFIERARARGLRSVCLFTTTTELHRGVEHHPSLSGPDVSARYVIEGATLEQVAAHLRSHHRIVAVVPHAEPTVAPLARLADLLGLDWAQPEVLPRFRDKHSLKAFLRTVDGGPRINAIAAVRTAEDVRKALATGPFERFVLKPNDGFGNSTIGFFDADGDPALLAAYLSDRAGAPLLMEEFIGGDEYFLDGQVDSAGKATTFAVWKYVREDINGRTGVATGDIAVPTTDPAFAPAVAYAAEVMRASGLRSSPFHLELKIDDAGPCLIEVGARLVGGELVDHDELMHGALDMVEVALEGYLGVDAAEPAVDWVSYDRNLLASVNGMSTSYGRIYEVEGTEQVESRPDFVDWAALPRVGMRLVPTVDLLTRPWRAFVRMPSEDRYRAVSDELRAAVRINATSTGVRKAIRQAAAYRPLVQARLAQMRRSSATAVMLPAP